jgi:hypothetical protein
LTEKGINSIVISSCYCSSVYDRMVSHNTHWARPEFSRSNVRGMNYPLVCFIIKSGCSFQSSDVRTMSKFSLSIAPYNSVSLELWHDLSGLLSTCKEIYGLTEHTCVHRQWTYTIHKDRPLTKFLIITIFKELSTLAWIFKNRKSFPPKFHLLFSCHIVLFEPCE